MIIESLALTDFRVFQGQHEFDLAPIKRWNSSRPIILFGGLNGAGKTTILTAVRLVLYGKQSLGSGVPQKVYDDFLRKSIHKSKDSVVQANYSAVSLCFSYSHMGVSSQFEIKRSWSVNGKKVNESIEIKKDSKLLKDLTYEQKQGFLNELIPIGVSDLFFFDGEKISELASDRSGNALSDSIKKLLGLDLVEKLHSDLGVFIRNQSRSKVDNAIKVKMEHLEAELLRVEALAGKAENAWRDARPSLAEAKTKLEQNERQLLAGGGAWAATRDQEIRKQDELLQTRQDVQDQIRKLLSGSYPLSLAQPFVTRTIEHLHQEHDCLTQSKVEEAKKHTLEKLKEGLSGALAKSQYEKVSSVIDTIIPLENHEDRDNALIHNAGLRTLASMEAQFREADGYARVNIDALSNTLAKLNLELDQIGQRIARAPDEGTLKAAMDEINSQRNIVDALNAKISAYREEAKRYLREAMEIARRLDALYATVDSEDSSAKTVKLAHKAQATLSEFSRKAAEQKIATLEVEFSTCFQNLARKDDIALSATIDPNSFRVALHDLSGSELDKNELSAGEKQIYAIAMLEALARTSGRKLPIIIDTPLGRLDSKHRNNLVHSYFPRASHQVLILSTDTEVDEQFYADLYKHMSRVYKLDYQSETGSTTASEGYFWRTSEQSKVA